MLIQQLRLQRGWSQQQLAELSGLSVQTIQSIEQGQAASTEALKSLAAVFDINFSAAEALAYAQVRKLKGFYLHLVQFVIVVTLLLGINLWTHPHYLWVVWVAIGWGLGLLFHGLRVFERLSPLGAEWEKKQVAKRLGKEI